MFCIPKKYLSNESVYQDGYVQSRGRVAQIPFCHCEPRPLRIVMVGVWQSHYIS